MNWSTFFTRTGTAIIFALVMLAGLLGPSWAFFVLLLVIQFLCIREYFILLPLIYPDTRYSAVLQGGVQIFGALLLFCCAPLAPGQDLLPALLFVPALFLLLVSLQAGSNINKAFHIFGAFLYLCLPIVLLMLLREKSMVIPMGLIALIWINDTMAYVVGSFIGKTPFSSISPKKTWEGTVGGAVLTVIAAVIYACFSPYYAIHDWVALALCAAVAGTLGDLFESKLKRLAGVKDSGSFMPGHGGALDRFDSLLVATPFAFCYAYLFMEPVSVSLF